MKVTAVPTVPVNPAVHLELTGEEAQQLYQLLNTTSNQAMRIGVHPFAYSLWERFYALGFRVRV